MLRTRRGPEAPDDRRQGSGRPKAIGKRHTATRGGAQLGRVGSYVISLGTGLLADVGTPDGRVDHLGASGFGFALEEQNLAWTGHLATRQSFANKNIDTPESQPYPL